MAAPTTPPDGYPKQKVGVPTSTILVDVVPDGSPKVKGRGLMFENDGDDDDDSIRSSARSLWTFRPRTVAVYAVVVLVLVGSSKGKETSKRWPGAAT
jgi:hypothetical protein